MKKFLLTSSVLALLTAAVGFNALAQPPGDIRPDGPPLDGGRPDRPMPPPNPVMMALDKDGNRELSEEEINNAVAALKTLDKNSDGKLDGDEIRPPRPDGPPRGPGREGRPDGPPRGDRPPGEDGPPDARRPRDGEGREPRSRDDRPPGGREDRRPDGPGDRGPGDREGRRSDGPDGPGRGPMGPPNPERFVEDAMRFDDDKDGKLSREELTRFAAEMANRPGRPPGPEGDRRPDGERGREGGRRPEGDRRPEGGRPQDGRPGDGPQRGDRPAEEDAAPPAPPKDQTL
jgi:hypothetical protein